MLGEPGCPTFAQRSREVTNDAVGILQHVIVPISQNEPTLSREPGVTLRITLLRVLATIEFNDEARFDTGEVRDVVPDRMLAPETRAECILTNAAP